jgi:hypothetical protein
MRLPETGDWRLARGEVDPPLGWYSASFGRRQPATTVIGEGTCSRMVRLETALYFEEKTPAKGVSGANDGRRPITQ